MAKATGSEWDAPAEVPGTVPAVAVETKPDLVAAVEKAAVELKASAAVPETPKSSSSGVKIKLLTTDVYHRAKGDSYLVYDTSTLEPRFLLVDKVAFTTKEQEVSTSEFRAGEEPYSWNDEIAKLTYTPAQIRLAVLFSGLVDKQDVNIREFTARTLMRGVLPFTGA